MTMRDLFRFRKLGLLNDDTCCNCVIERKRRAAMGAIDAMGKAVALLLPLIACGGSAEATIKNDGGFGRSSGGGWIAVSKSESAATYMYPFTAHRQGNLVHMWSLINYKSPQKHSASSLSFMSVKSENGYDCETAKWRTLSSSAHTHQMGNGQTVFSTAESIEWQPVTPNSDSETLWKVACKKATPKGRVR